MRGLFAPILVVLLLSAAPAALAQERVLFFTTSVDPDFYVFDQDDYQRDANGDRIRDEEGRYKLERQFLTLSVEARMECTVPPDGEQVALFAEGPSVHLRNASTTEIISTYLDLEPRDFNLTWQQDTLAGEWVAEGQFQIEVLSNAKPRNTIEGNYTWHIEQVDIPEACPQDAWDADQTSHVVVVPGFDYEEQRGNPNRDTDGDGISDAEDDDLDGDGKTNKEDDDADGDGLANIEDPSPLEPNNGGAPGRGIPAPGAVGLIAALGLAVALRRRS